MSYFGSGPTGAVGSAPAGWYPDPARVHEFRYFENNIWTDHVSDHGNVSEVPLGPAPPGMVGWFPPEAMVQSALSEYIRSRPALVAVPRTKMWILAVLSLSVIWIGSGGSTVVLPLGIAFATWCWLATAEPLKSHEAVGSPEVGRIKAARWTAVALAFVGWLQAMIWMR